jgi:hypothetical protein
MHPSPTLPGGNKECKYITNHLLPGLMDVLISIDHLEWNEMEKVNEK